MVVEKNLMMMIKILLNQTLQSFHLFLLNILVRIKSKLKDS